MKKVSRVVIVLFSLSFGLLLGGLIFGAFTLGPYQQYRASADWASTIGEVRQSEVVRQGGERNSYQVRISYMYQVDGRPYQAERYQFSGAIYTSNYDDQITIVQSYPPGRAVTVWYDPDDPANATLLREMSGGLEAFVVISTGMLVGGVVCGGLGILAVVLKRGPSFG